MSIDAGLPSDPRPPATHHDDQPHPSQVLLADEGDGLIVWLETPDEGPVLHLEGALDLAGGAHLGTTVEQVQATDPRKLTIDATALRFVDLSGYRALLACRSARGRLEHRRTLLVGPAVARLRRLVEMAGCGFERNAPRATGF